jgi:uncharacterized coiled-coil protein SlyX
MPVPSRYFFRAIALSALFASCAASAQMVQAAKCPAAGCQTAPPSFPTAQANTQILENRVATLESKIATLEGKLAALESKFAAQDGKISAHEGDINKLMNHTHDVNTSFNFSSTVVSDINGAHKTVAIPLSGFGSPHGSSGKPKF